ncbi:MAG: beta-propeller domain-containing protein [Candidatus Woesearchaeota archaeon]
MNCTYGKLCKVSIILFVLIFLISCTSIESQDTPEFSVNSDVTEEELREILSFSEFDAMLGMRTTGMQPLQDAMSSVSVAESSVTSPRTSDHFTPTNVQVAQIDEGDIFKTDGSYIYTRTGSELFIISAQGAESEIVYSDRLNVSHITGILIKDNILFVYAQSNHNQYFSFTTSEIFVYNISQPSSPELLEHSVVEGRILESRLMDKTIYLISQTQPTLSRPIPFFGRSVTQQSDISLRDIQIVGQPQNPQYMTIHTFDTHNLEWEHNAILLDRVQDIYMSPNNIFVTTQRWVREEDLVLHILQDIIVLSQDEEEIIQLIEDTPSVVLSQREKDMKIMQVYVQHIASLDMHQQEDISSTIEDALEEKMREKGSRQFTRIYRIPLSDSQFRVSHSVEIPGRLVNQFAMDEYDEVLRVATTIPRDWLLERDSENHVYTFDMNFNQLDSVTGIAPTESIFSTRYVGDRLYMVTFEEIDPFFVIDLSDPENITILGELKITGFSRYLHPIDDHTILGFGQQATEQGRITGLKISLFDVSDVHNPRELTYYEGGDRFAYSSVLFEHRAFMYDAVNELLVLPIQNHGWDGEQYAGAFVFEVTNEHIEKMARIDHLQDDSVWNSMVERSAIIQDSLYTKSSRLLRVHSIDSFTSLKNIGLHRQEHFDDIVYR